MKLGVLMYPTGYHVAAWRHENVVADGGVNFPHYLSMTRLAESACFDFVFLADSATTQGDNIEALSHTAIRYQSQFEPITLLSALSSTTKKIGLVATASTTYSHPYHLARAFGSLDVLSGGRAGWNVVTSSNANESRCFGSDIPPSHRARYARASEFVDVVKKLWRSWDDDAFVRDKASGLFYDPRKRRVIAHHGTNFSVNGSLNVPRSAQGQPVVVQSGSSPAGIELAGASAEVVFTAQQSMESAKAFRSEVRTRVSANERQPDQIPVLVGLFPFIGRTTAEAREKFDALQSLIMPIVGVSLLNEFFPTVNLTEFPIDGPIPDCPPTEGLRSRQELLCSIASKENLTINELYLQVAGSRGHLNVTGSGAEVADIMSHWIENEACDGFILIPPALPWGLEDFVRYVIPELRRRDLFRSNYSGSTLRDHLGLPECTDPTSGG